MNQEALTLSPTVQSVQNELSSQNAVTSKAIVNAILARHPEYGSTKGKTKTKHFSSGKEISKNITQWLTEISDLYNTKKVTTLHGRLVILGLGILDDQLGEELSENDFLSSIANELQEPLANILSSNGFSILPQLKN